MVQIAGKKFVFSFPAGSHPKAMALVTELAIMLANEKALVHAMNDMDAPNWMEQWVGSYRECDYAISVTDMDPKAMGNSGMNLSYLAETSILVQYGTKEQIQFRLDRNNKGGVHVGSAKEAFDKLKGYKELAGGVGGGNKAYTGGANSAKQFLELKAEYERQEKQPGKTFGTFK